MSLSSIINEYICKFEYLIGRSAQFTKAGIDRFGGDLNFLSHTQNSITQVSRSTTISVQCHCTDHWSHYTPYNRAVLTRRKQIISWYAGRLSHEGCTIIHPKVAHGLAILSGSVIVSRGTSQWAGARVREIKIHICAVSYWHLRRNKGWGFHDNFRISDRKQRYSCTWIVVTKSHILFMSG